MIQKGRRRKGRERDRRRDKLGDNQIHVQIDKHRKKADRQERGFTKSFSYYLAQKYINFFIKQGHRHKSCALFKQNVEILKNFQKLSKPLINSQKLSKIFKNSQELWKTLKNSQKISNLLTLKNSQKLLKPLKNSQELSNTLKNSEKNSQKLLKLLKTLKH